MIEYELKPSEWRDRLMARLLAEQPFNVERIAWYLGRQNRPVVPKQYQPSYALLLEMSTNPWTRLIIDAIAERLTLQGMIIGAQPEADAEAWRIFEGNHIDADQRLVHSEALILGRSYYSVWYGEQEQTVSIVPESATQVIHEPDPVDRRRTLAALKVWRDDLAQRVYAILFLDDSIWKWWSPIPDDTIIEGDTSGPSAVGKDAYRQQRYTWHPIGVAPNGDTVITDVTEDDAGEDNPLGRIPIVPLNNRPTLFAGGQSEIDDLIPVLRRVDKLVLDMILAAEVGAFRQKWATGLDIPKDPETNKAVEVYDAAIRKLWTSDSPDTRFGDFNPTDLGPYLKAIDAQVAELSAVSRVPSYYLVSPNLVNPPSAETLRAAEAGLIHKARGLANVWGESYEQVMTLAMMILEDERATESKETVWKDPELRSEAAVADAAVKWSTLGVPQEALWAMGGASPEQISRWKLMQAQEALTSQVLNPPPPVPDEDEGEPPPDEETV